MHAASASDNGVNSVVGGVSLAAIGVFDGAVEKATGCRRAVRDDCERRYNIAANTVLFLDGSYRAMNNGRELFVDFVTSSLEL